MKTPFFRLMMIAVNKPTRPLKCPLTPSQPPLHRPRDGPALIHHVICDEPNAKVGDFEGVSFWIAGAYLPREGEVFCLDDGTLCKVKAVTFNVARIKGEKFILAMPNVYAVKVKKRGKR